VSEAYVQTRTTLFSSRLLPPEVLPPLVSLPLSEAVEPLRQAKLAHFLPDETRPSEGTLEARIVGVLLAELEILVRAFRGAEREFLVHWARRFEVGNLKTLARGKIARRAAPDLRRDLMDLGAFSTLPTEELLQTEDIAELLTRLERTAYAEIAREARRAFEQQQDLLSLDTAMDRRYYAGVVARESAISGHPGLRELVALTIDRINLGWLLRYRLAYGLPPGQLYYFLVPSPYRLNGRRLRELAPLAELSAVLDALPSPYREWLADSRDAGEVRARMETRVFIRARELLRGSARALPRVFAYLLLREYDLRQVRAMIRGKVLDLDAETISEAMGIPA
jgi:V/A-type H+-transporting ATPase subunit C